MSDEIYDGEVDVAAPEVDKPDNEAEPSGAPEQGEPSSGEDSFTEFDPSSIPESGADPKWLKEQYDHMRGDYTRKMQEFGETRRTAEQLQTILDGIKEGDPQTIQSYLNLLGVDQQRILEAYGLEMAEQEAEEAGQGLEAEDDFGLRDPRVDQLLQERQAEQAERAQQAEQQNAVQYAEETGARMEQELSEAFGGTPDEDASNWILARALDHPDNLGEPDVKGAVQAWNAMLDRQQEKWLASRQGPRATTSGVPGSERFDTSTKEGRLELARQGAARARSSAQ